MSRTKYWEKYRDNQYIKNRITWDRFFVNICKEVAKRSHDAQSQYGAVLVSQQKEIIATGYNGFIRNIDDSVLPNLRPAKYPFMIHAEHNCILSCARQGKSTINHTLYISGNPCLHCFQLICHVGISEIVYPKGNVAHMNKMEENYLEDFAIIKSLTGIRIKELPENF